MPPTYQVGSITLSLLDSAEEHKPPVEKHSICCREPSVGEVHILLFGSGVINTTECTKKRSAYYTTPNILSPASFSLTCIVEIIDMNCFNCFAPG